MVSITQTGGIATISFTSLTGGSYQVQSTPVVTPTSWTNEGAPLAGNGGIVTYMTPTGGQQKFFRVVCQ